MPFEMNMLIMKHFHHLNTGMEGKKPSKVAKSTPKNTNQALSIIYRQDVKIKSENLQFFQLWPKILHAQYG